MTPPRALSRANEARASSVPRAPLTGLPEETKVKTLLRSIAVLEEWLEQNEGHKDEVRLRRMKRWREEALEQLGL